MLSDRFRKLPKPFQSSYWIIVVLTLLLAIQVLQNQRLLQGQTAAVTSYEPEPLLVGEYVDFPTLLTTTQSPFDITEGDSAYHMVIFFHTECEYCAKDRALWQTIHDQALDRDINVVAVTTEGNTEAVRQYVLANKLPFPVLLDPDRQLFEQLEIRVTPTKVLLSDKMQVLHVWRGWTTQSSSDLGGLLTFLEIEPRELPQFVQLSDSGSVID